MASFVNNGAFLIVLGSCLFFVAAGRITLGEVVGITNMMNFVLTPSKAIANGMIRLKAMDKVKAELESLLELESENDNKESLEENIREIRLEHVQQKINDSFSLDKLMLNLRRAKRMRL